MALPAYEKRYKRGEVDPGELIFFANWQAQAARILAHQTADRKQRAAVSEYLHGLMGDIEDSSFYQEVDRMSSSQATVEVRRVVPPPPPTMPRPPTHPSSPMSPPHPHTQVACALEALADAFSLAVDDGDSVWQASYAAHIKALVHFLNTAQVQEGPGVPAEMVGGFGHRQHLSTQRIDVTGHIVCGYMKLLGHLGEE